MLLIGYECTLLGSGKRKGSVYFSCCIRSVADDLKIVLACMINLLSIFRQLVTDQDFPPS